MKYDPLHHHRHSIRIPGYDYSLKGGYFVTIVVQGRAHIFGAVFDGEMHLNELGRIARDQWLKTSFLRPYIELREDEFVVMPNHIHGIIWIHEMEGVDARRGAAALRPRAEHRSAPTPAGPDAGSLGAIVRAYKSAVTQAIHQRDGQRRLPVWQRNYYEHVIRGNADDLSKREYIMDNPRNWDTDEER